LIEQGLRDAGRWEGDVERRAANGVIKTIRLKCVLSSSAEIVETGADVSVEKRLEEALSRAEHRYYNVFGPWPSHSGSSISRRLAEWCNA
jgi:hypothetical protein